MRCVKCVSPEGDCLVMKMEGVYSRLHLKIELQTKGNIFCCLAD